MLRATSTLALVLALLPACGPKPAEQAPPSPEQPAPTTATPPPAAGDDGAAQQCSVDADCVPAGCCHPSTCVPVSEKPNCTDVMCTMNCQPGTLDCGGRCACEAGSCKAILGQP